MKKVPELRFPGFNDEWHTKKLGNLGTFFKGSGISKADLSEDGILCVLYGQLYTTYGEVIDEINSKTNIQKDKLVIGHINDVLIPSSGESAIDIATASCLQKDNIALGGDLNVFRPSKENGVFISYQLNNSKKKEIAKIAQGASVVHVYNEQLKTVKVDIPSEDEQLKIATFFSVIDKKIKAQQDKVEALEEYKKGIIQKIFSQEIRFRNEDGSNYSEWKETKIGKIFNERNERGEQEFELLSVTMKDGVTSRNDIDTKDNSRDDKSNYKVVQPNDIVYNSMRMWQGASGVSKYTGIVSPAYTVLIPNKDICSEYFGYLFKTPKVINEFRKYSQGLTSDTWNLKYPLIKDIKVLVPSYQEQMHVVKFLKTLDAKLRNEKAKLEEVKLYKKYLLQKMFI